MPIHARSTPSADGTAALDKAFDVLDAIGSAPHGLSQVDLADRLKLPRTTLYRILGSLVARGLIRRDPLRRVYCMGFRCFEYARVAYAMPDLVAAANLELRALRDMTGETTYLSTLDGHDVVSLERVDGAHNLRAFSEIGERKPLHCTSTGKAILSALPPQERDALVRDIPLLPRTPRTITDRRKLHAELQLTATRGWAIDDEEIAQGVRCCGAPVVDSAGRVRGAISVAGPAFRLTLERLQVLGPEVAEVARRIGAHLVSSEVRSDGQDVHAVPGEWAFFGAQPLWLASVARLAWIDTLAPTIHLASKARDTVAASLTQALDHLILCPSPAGDMPAGAAVEGLAVQRRSAEGIELAVPAMQDTWECYSLSAANPSIHAALSDPDLAMPRLHPSGHRAPSHWPRQRLQAATMSPEGRLWACIAAGERWRVCMRSDDGQWVGGVVLPEPVTSLSVVPHEAVGKGMTAMSAKSPAVLIAAGPASGTLYWIDTHRGTSRRLATLPKGSGEVAGICSDAQGKTWVALFGGWSVLRFDRDGHVDRVVALPVPCPTGVALSDDGDLYVTTARDAVNREALEAAPLSGRLLRVCS